MLAFSVPFTKPKSVKGSDLAEFFENNSLKYHAKYRVDQNITYLIYGVTNDVSYDQIKEFCSANKLGAGFHSAYFNLDNHPYQICYQPEGEENLTPYVLKDYSTKNVKAQAKEEKVSERNAKKLLRQEEKLRRLQEKEEKKQWGNARAVENKNKILEILNSAPMTAEDIAEKADLSYATVNKLVGKLVDTEQASVVKGKGKGQKGKAKRQYVKN